MRPKKGQKTVRRKRESMKKERKKRERSIDEAISPPFSSGPVHLVCPETESEDGERERKAEK